MQLNSDTPDFETLLSSTLYLLSRKPEEIREKLGKRVYEHFALLLKQPEMRNFPMLEKHCINLMNQWKENGTGRSNCPHHSNLYPVSTRLQ